MSVEKTGYGMGYKDFPVANCVRTMLGEAFNNCQDKVTGLSFNVDDMTGEETGFAIERLYELGAKEVYTVPIGMKKSRPGVLIEVLCDTSDKGAMISAIFKHTSTIGIREKEYNRYVLERTEEDIHTEFGVIRRKSSHGYGVNREKYEYDDLSKIATIKGMSLKEIKDRLLV